MTIDLNRYRRAVKPIVDLFRGREPNAPQSTLIVRIAVATNCPIIAVAHYYKELYGSNEELETMITRLINFYKVDSVVGTL